MLPSRMSRGLPGLDFGGVACEVRSGDAQREHEDGEDNRCREHREDRGSGAERGTALGGTLHEHDREQEHHEHAAHVQEDLGYGEESEPDRREETGYGYEHGAEADYDAA